MAEIKIRKKRPMWPWIVLILIIIGALVYYGLMRGRTGHIGDAPSERIDNGTGAYSRDINFRRGDIIKKGGSIRTKTFKELV